MIQAELDLIRRIAKEHYHGGLCLDVGGSDAAFRSRPKFPYDLSGLFERYLVADMKDAPGVDVVCDAREVHSNIGARQASFLVCTNLLEHVERPWSVIYSCWLATKEGGVAIFSVPWEYQMHPDPVDYWRISPECLHTLCTSEQMMFGEGTIYKPMFTEIESGMLTQPGIKVAYFVGRANA